MRLHDHELPRSDWQRYLEALTDAHEGAEVTIEVLDQELGDQPEVERLPLAYVGYDPEDASANQGGRILEHGPRPHLVTNPNSRFYQLLQTGLDELLV